jgi:hypothetical protein
MKGAQLTMETQLELPLEQPSPKKKRVFREKTSAHYVDNKIFATEITKWVNDNKDRGKRIEWTPMPPYIVESIIKIVEHFAHQSCWNNYSFLDIMKSEAILNCVKGIHGFKIQISPNAFSYTSEIVRKSFIYVLDKEKNQANIKNEQISRQSIYNYDKINLYNDEDVEEVVHE